MKYPDSEETLKWLRSKRNTWKAVNVRICRSREVQTLPSCMRDGTVDAETVFVKAQRTALLYFRVKSDCHLNYQFGFRFRQCNAIDICSANIQYIEKLHGLRMSSMNGDTPSVGNQITLLILYMLTCFEWSRLNHSH